MADGYRQIYIDSGHHLGGVSRDGRNMVVYPCRNNCNNHRLPRLMACTGQTKGGMNYDQQ